MSETFVIVGASLTGATAAVELRRLGHSGPIVLIGEERHLPYERPPLSKELLRGESKPDDAAVHTQDVYTDEGIDLRLGRAVTQIDRARLNVVLEDGEQIAFDRLLLATGARPRRLRAPGAELDGVLTLRTVDDSLALRERLRTATRLAVVGGGWIGCEVAASATQMGTEVTLIEASAAPLEHVLGTELGQHLAGVHEKHGVRVLTGHGVASFDRGESGIVSGVRLMDGTRVPCDLAVVGVGVEPVVELANFAGLSVGNGIDVDGLLRTSDPTIFAAGDVAAVEHPRYGRLRVEHWENARRQGSAVAASMLGEGSPFDAIPYFFSDQYDVGLEYTGMGSAHDQVVYRGDPAGGEFIAFWLHRGRVTAGMNVNVWDVADDIARLIRSEDEVDIAQLCDQSVALGELADAGV